MVDLLLASRIDLVERYTWPGHTKGTGAHKHMGTDPRVALGTHGEVPWIYLGAGGGGGGGGGVSTPRPYGRLTGRMTHLEMVSLYLL